MIKYMSLADWKEFIIMFSKKILVNSLALVGILFVILLFVTEENSDVFTKMIVVDNSKKNSYVDEIVEIDTEKEEEEDANIDDSAKEATVETVSVSKPEIVYDGMTLEELANKLDRSLKNELHGKGYLYASYSLEKGVDPYLAVAISLEETGCNWNCSNLVRSCNNVGGMKGSGCGSYGYFNTLDDGIRAFIDNIQRNYVAYGLTTAETMNSKYAENPAWSVNVNNYINRIKSN